MTALVSWVVFPLVLAAISLGLGLLVEAVSGVRLHGALLFPTGFAAMIIVGQLATAWSPTVPLATPAVVVLAAAGMALNLERLRGPVDIAAATAAIAVYAVYMAPVALSGGTTFAGWIKLDDGAWWLAVTDRIMTHGRSVAGLQPSSYEATVQYELATSGYPIGSFLPLGIGHVITRQDSAWLLQPYMAFLAAMLALVLYALVSRVIASRVLRALVAFAAAQAALTYGFALWGGVKEVAAALLVALAAALVTVATQKNAPVRSVIPLAVATAALAGALSVGAAIWLAPMLLGGAALALHAHGWGFILRRAGLLTGVVLVLSIPTLVIAKAFIRWERDLSTLTKNDLVNLFRPLKPEQIVGIWPAGDFRVDPGLRGPAYVLIAVAAAAAAYGLYRAWRSGAPELVLYTGGALVSLVLLMVPGSPWIDAKALATASPAFLVAAAVG
ncbi:MAG: hypothetical protein WCJ67_12415, partial [Thermoleophilia bacterium]